MASQNDSAQVIAFPMRERPLVTIPAEAEAGAEILSFPPVQPTVVVAAPPADDAQERLARALATLNAALEEQRAAVMAWRDALGTLKTTVGGLHSTMNTYRGSLDRLGTDVSALNTEAKRLEQWADGALATQPASR